MPTDPSAPLKTSRAKRSCFTEVSEAEKQLWKRIHSNGVLDKDVKNMYHKACCIYEKLFLSNHELPALQNIEYLLWRLHYKHIDEFRKAITQSSAKVPYNLATSQKTAVSTLSSIDVHMEGFRLFLSEAIKFYQNLIREFKRYYGLLNEPWFYKNDGVSGRIEQSKLHKCQFVCHRLCICLGDLARYLELYGTSDNHQRNWSGAASYYLEATKIYPDGGNPQNQLAVLATYIGDEFLALYHCIRSLAVNEPFPDALQNLLLLFERNRLSDITSLSNEVYDFCKPSDWISSTTKASTTANPTNHRTLEVDESAPSAATDLWTLFIRLSSFFFLESSLDAFTCTFASTLRELETLLALDVSNLSSALQSYQSMKLLKNGPYRVLHMISVLLFIIYNLTDNPEWRIPKAANDGQKSMLVSLAVSATFTFMGRLADRCLKGGPVVYFPLLPALLVFVEWLVDAIGKLDTDDEKCKNSMCYFFGSFVKLLNHLQENRGQITSTKNIALWEDYELRGFIPLSPSHDFLDFSSHWEDEINYKMKNEYRAHRIVQAAIKIARRFSDDHHTWFLYDEAGTKFSAVQAQESLHRKALKEQESCPGVESTQFNQQIDSGKSTAVDEEEDIVFKPLARHNSEPIKMKEEPTKAGSDECLKRASSLLVAQNRVFIDSLTSCAAILSTSSSKQPGQNEFRLKGADSSTESHVAAGPPSLSSWVLNGDKLFDERAKNIEAERTMLTSIKELSSEDLRCLSLTNDDSFGIASPVTCSSSYSAPSVPSLLKTADWFTGASADFVQQNALTHEPLRFASPSSPLNLYQGNPPVPGFMDHSSPSLETADYHPRRSPQFSNPNHRVHDSGTQDQCIPPMNFSSVNSAGVSLDYWSNKDPLVSVPAMYLEGTPPLFHPSPSLLHGLHAQRKDAQNHDHQKPRPYVAPVIPVTGPEPQPLLQYLKQREWQLQQESQFTGSYMRK